MTEETQTLKKDVVPAKYREAYKATGGTNGDFIAKRLQEIGKDGTPALQAVMKENGIPAKKWGSMNPGQQRMNLSNVIRSRFLKGDDITILGKQYNVRHMADEWNGTLAKDKPASFVKFADDHNIKNDDRTIGILTRTFFPPDTQAKKAEAKAVRDEQAKTKAEAKAQAAAGKKAAADAKKEAAAKAKTDKAAAAKAAKAEKGSAKVAAKASAKEPAPAS